MVKKTFAAVVIIAGLSIQVEASAQTVVVREGDTLSRIAQRTFGEPHRWRELCEINKDTLQSCDIIQPGVTLLTGRAEATTSGGEINVVLNCAAVGQSTEVRRELTLQRADKVVTLSRGRPGSHGYEQWTGEIDDDGTLTVTGEYVEGNPETKRVSMTGNISSDGLIAASGTRGPRQCTLNSQPSS